MRGLQFHQAFASAGRRAVAACETILRCIPAVQRRLEARYEALLADIEPSLKPYRNELPAITRLPTIGRSRDEILDEMRRLAERETPRWREGYVSGAVYHGDPDHQAFLSQAYALHAASNPLHVDLWPSVARYESEIVAMTASMLGGASGVCGTVTSGGTESILLAMKTYRDWARERRGIRRPEVVVPHTAHAAFDKAAHYFGIRLVRIPVDAGFRADVSAVRRAISHNTIALVGSAPSFPHGVIDPIADIAALARERRIGMHVDACLGGFVLPWARRLGYPVTPFDFSVPGVTSISVDTHKYGYAAKGTSVVLYRTEALRRYQYYVAADWPGGLYVSPTMAGSRPGGLSAAAWAAMVSIGEQGYLEATRRILETARRIRCGIESIPELRVLGDPLWVIAFASMRLDIYRVLDQMAQRGWNLNGLHHPPAIHICVTLLHTQPGVADRFIADLRDAVAAVRREPRARGGMAPVYGMAASLPFRGVVSDLLRRYLDAVYRV
ncbi:aminotransferase class V-fold PLP-dependent enzyme [Roseiflexus sp.]|uniref:pyridoxal phosphate-dependent decarboxylase family protein n=1 Tax=Roseiflexus sp. TaxID=2562120 RepID=UPI0021DC4049|nr:aminotransferase class V-fold PLP-dependent enzyme [Roseiflexus sp.]GIW00861.1 MAG: aspartate aminotransferase family protein [Roseiflexus sp.]